MKDTMGHRIRVRYAETDRMGVVYYANYFVWMEVGRVESLRQKGLVYKDLEDQGIHLPVVETGCKYKTQVCYDDEIDVIVRIDSVGRASIVFSYSFVRDGDEVAAGFSRHAFVNRQGHPIPVPEFILDVLI